MPLKNASGNVEGVTDDMPLELRGGIQPQMPLGYWSIGGAHRSKTACRSPKNETFRLSGDQGNRKGVGKRMASVLSSRKPGECQAKKVFQEDEGQMLLISQ